MSDVFVSPPFRVHRELLSNGLRVCTVEASHLHSAVVALYVRAGSRYETRAQNGLSHFVEHMLFRGSKGYPSSHALNRAIEERGGTLNAETGRDYSLYQISLHPREVGAALRILGDLFTHPLFTEIERERRIILEELLDDLDENGRNLNLHDLSRGLAWGEHPLGYPVIGTGATIRGFSVSDVKRHFKKLYGARNMVLCVGGRVDHKEILAQVKHAFAAVPQGKRCKPRPARVAFDGPRFRFVQDEASQVQLHLLFQAVPEWDPDFFALGMLMRLLDDGMSTPLHYRIADQKGLAYHIGAGIEALHDATVVEVDAASSPRNLPRVLAEILQILSELRHGDFVPEDLERAKRRSLADMEVGFDDVDGLCSWFGGTELFFKPYSHAERAARIKKVSVADIVRVARRIFRPERSTLVTVGVVKAPERRRIRALIKEFGVEEPE